ncbi:MAG: hypothetical protein LWW97_03675 [Deltaproteobacteria bacterium]|nr:hypothetical protein [Deltaproteobacteria bacterium]
MKKIQIHSMLEKPPKKLFENDKIEFKGKLGVMTDQLRQYDEVTRKVT